MCVGWGGDEGGEAQLLHLKLRGPNRTADKVIAPLPVAAPLVSHYADHRGDHEEEENMSSNNKYNNNNNSDRQHAAYMR